MPRLFISYRTDDSVHVTTAIADRLARHFGAENVFRDRDSLRLGEVYPASIRRALERSDVVLAVIGPHWLDIRDESGHRRVDNPADWVRTELRMAFERGIPVVPILLDSTPRLHKDDLPTEIASLALCTNWRVRHESFESDLRWLIDNLPGDTASVTAEPSPRAGQNVQTVTADHSTVYVNQGTQYNNTRPAEQRWT